MPLIPMALKGQLYVCQVDKGWTHFWGVNLARLQSPVIQSNISLDLSVKLFMDVIRVHSQLSVSEEDYFR